MVRMHAEFVDPFGRNWLNLQTIKPCLRIVLCLKCYGCRRCLRMNTKWNKRHAMLSRGGVMLHDNARPHTAAATQDLITTFGWEQFNHPPYSPDLAQSDFHVFLHLKTFLSGGRWFHDKVKEAVNTWFALQVASFYDAGIQKLVPRYNCLNIGGNCRKVA
jgi:hypothetical protein